MDQKTPPASRTPGVPPFGAARQGPLGPRPVLPDKAQALTDMAESARAASENPLAEDPVPEIPDQRPSKEEPKEEEKSKEKDPFSSGSRSVFEEIENLANMGQIKDALFAKRMQYLDCKERREKIESRCTALDFNEYVVRGELRQEVYIWGPKESKRPSVTFRTISMEDEIIIRMFLSGDFSAPLVSDVAQSFLMLTAGVINIGQLKLPEFPEKDKSTLEDRKKVFKMRLETLIKQPYVVVWDLYINYLWFQGRVREALYGEDGTFQ